MEKSPGIPGREMTEPTHDSDRLIKEFVSHWGLMARAWGINSTMGELFALLYITGTEWTAEDLRNWLGRFARQCQHEFAGAAGVGSRPQGPPVRRTPRVVPGGDRRMDFISQDPERTQTPRARSEPERARSCVQSGRGMTLLCEHSRVGSSRCAVFSIDRCAGGAALVICRRATWPNSTDSAREDAESTAIRTRPMTIGLFVTSDLHDRLSMRAESSTGHGTRRLDSSKLNRSDAVVCARPRRGQSAPDTAAIRFRQGRDDRRPFFRVVVRIDRSSLCGVRI